MKYFIVLQRYEAVGSSLNRIARTRMSTYGWKVDVAEHPGYWQLSTMQMTTFEASADDLLAAYRLNLTFNLKSNRARRKLILGGLAVSGTSAVAAWIWDFVSVPVAALGGLAYWTLFIAAVFSAAYLRLPRQSKRIYAQQKSLQGITSVKWSKDGISFDSAKGHSNFNWLDFTEIFASSDLILLRQSDNVMNFIPTRALTDDQIAELVGNRMIDKQAA